MTAEARVDVHHGAPRCLLSLFDAAATGLADWSEFDAEAERWGIEVRGLSREDLTVRIESSTLEIPTPEHRRLHQEASDFVRWGRRGGRRTLALYGRLYFLLLARVRWGRVEAEALIEPRAGSSKGEGRCDPLPRVLSWCRRTQKKKDADGRGDHRVAIRTDRLTARAPRG
jgi:hypothetical protein